MHAHVLLDDLTRVHTLEQWIYYNIGRWPNASAVRGQGQYIEE